MKRKPRTERPKILIVDHNPKFAESLRLRLRANNFEIVQASDGYSAVAVSQKEHPDVVVIDLALPGGDAFLALERLHNQHELAHIPVIVLAPRERHTSQERVLRLGAKALLQRSPDHNELIQVIRSAL
jgi:DNA-binding response OmpR family regulator